jgi:hypothetical protein
MAAVDACDAVTILFSQKTHLGSVARQRLEVARARRAVVVRVRRRRGAFDRQLARRAELGVGERADTSPANAE